MHSLDCCSDLRISVVSARDFKCKVCRGCAVDAVSEELKFVEIEGDTYEVVDKFCYLGDMIDCHGSSQAAATARIRAGWRKFKELSSFICGRGIPLKRPAMMYAAETWPIKENELVKMEAAEMRMLKLMLGLNSAVRKSRSEVRGLLIIESIGL